MPPCTASRRGDCYPHFHTAQTNLCSSISLKSDLLRGTPPSSLFQYTANGQLSICQIQWPLTTTDHPYCECTKQAETTTICHEIKLPLCDGHVSHDAFILVLMCNLLSTECNSFQTISLGLVSFI